MGKDLSKVAIVVPTIRPESMGKFLLAWEPLITKHNATVLIVKDGDSPFLLDDEKFTIPQQFRTHHTAAVRNIGFAYIAQKLPSVQYIITLDDDLTPVGDPIADHIKILGKMAPISWFPTTIIKTPIDYMRGFPYGVRLEAPIMVSHGVWEGTPDYDAPSQLLSGGIQNGVEFYRGIIPKGALFPMCGMNLAFTRAALPYMYFAPVGQYKGAERMDDIWLGIEMKKDFDRLGWAVATGYARVHHARASNVFKNLVREAVGIQKNEEHWKGDHDVWYTGYLKKRYEWFKWINLLMSNK